MKTEPIGETKQGGKSYECQLLNEPLNIENAQNLGKNEPQQHAPPPAQPCFFQPWIGERNQVQSVKRNKVLKDTNVSFKMSAQALKTPNIWARTNLFKPAPPCSSKPLHAFLHLEFPSVSSWANIAWPTWALAIGLVTTRTAQVVVQVEEWGHTRDFRWDSRIISHPPSI